MKTELHSEAVQTAFEPFRGGITINIRDDRINNEQNCCFKELMDRYKVPCLLSLENEYYQM